MKKGKAGITIAVLCIILAIGIEVAVMSRAKISSSIKINSKEISNEEKVEELIELGVSNLKTDKYEEALEAFGKVLEIDEDNNKALGLTKIIQQHKEIVALYEEGNYSKAVDLIPLMGNGGYDTYITEKMKKFNTEVAIKYNSSNDVSVNWSSTEETVELGEDSSEAVESYEEVDVIPEVKAVPEEQGQEEYSFEKELIDIDNAEALVWSAKSWEEGTTITYMGQQNIQGKEYYVFRPYHSDSQNSKSVIVEMETKEIYLYNADYEIITAIY